MPRALVRADEYDPNRSLGWLAVSWMEFFVRHGRGDVQGQPIRHGDEMTEFIVGCYAVGESPSNNHLLHDSAYFSRPKGADKSGLGARLGLFEGLGPARWGGWARGGEVYCDPWGFGFEYVYEPGEPIGVHVVDPYLRILATEEGQTGNVFDSIYYNLTNEDCPLAHVPGIDPGLTRIYLPGGGRIQPSTASSSSKDGGLETWCCFDESHLYHTPELKRMYKTVTRNLRKRKGGAGTWYLETTTMHAAGEESIAEATHREQEAIRTGKKRRGRARLLFDHRWGEVADLRDERQLRAGLTEAFGEAIAWQDIDGLVDECYDTRTDPAEYRRYFLNVETSTSDAWITAAEWDACGRPEKSLAPRDVVTLGFDGAISDDSTALVACRVSDGHLELIGLWERPEGRLGDDWQVDTDAVDAAVHEAMRRFRVVGMYADPAHWRDRISTWTAKYGDKMKVRAHRARPLEWATNRPSFMVAALELFYEAVRGQGLSFTPPQDRVERERDLAVSLRRAVLNARRKPTRAGLQIRKEYPKSPLKIDAAVAAVLAYQARADAISSGMAGRVRRTGRVRRLR